MTRVGDKDVASLEWREVNAVLWSCRDFGRTPDYAGIPEILAAKAAGRVPPYTLDVWVRGLRVLSIAWNTRDEIKLVRMTRGDWECDYFQLPVLSGRLAPTIH
jgi:hypothetical protein